jgi:NDP-sugar pyrophosphorylase family protein
MNRNLKALLLLGGEGTRLRPITHKIPKALLQVHGKTIVEHLFDLFRKYHIRDVIFSVGYLKEKIEDYFDDGSNFGMNIEYVKEQLPLGTAGPIKKASRLYSLPETFIVSNGDELKDIDINNMLKQHKKTNAIVTIALTSVENPEDYGVAKLDGDRIVEFVEKPKPEKAPSRFINAGFYIMQKEILRYIPEGFTMLEKHVFPAIAKQGKLYGCKFKGQWFDIGTIDRYKEAIKSWQGIK